jgi:hypothetical protein
MASHDQHQDDIKGSKNGAEVNFISQDSACPKERRLESNVDMECINIEAISDEFLAKLAGKIVVNRRSTRTKRTFQEEEVISQLESAV